MIFFSPLKFYNIKKQKGKKETSEKIPSERNGLKKTRSSLDNVTCEYKRK